jgi:hypothetical protein
MTRAAERLKSAFNTLRKQIGEGGTRKARQRNATALRQLRDALYIEPASNRGISREILE